MNRTYYENYSNYPDDRDDDSSILGNPIPLALIGLGVGWLVWSNTSHPGVDNRLRDARRRARQYGNTALHRASELRDQAMNRAGEFRDQAVNRASELRDQVSDRASDLRDQAGDATQSMRDRVKSQTGGQQRQGFSDYSSSDSYGRQTDYKERARQYGDKASRRARQGYGSVVSLVDEHPLMAGVMGIAVGAVIGASIPASRYENELLGDYSDEFYSRAREFGSEAVDRATTVVRTAAEAGVDAARDAGQEEAQKQGLTAEQVEKRAEEKTNNA
ncbi:hypothetical protein N825_10205 [Skermanella stibiiresistens SB22]|uniref:YtxH domain-containing protein n=1 Tax=Skermanella stibiiresistens SB22 TaxID=1385369 RepID=W9H2B3_9PROT|nr:hypothetical protein [Skermanella stibiiresistens]EWY38951.1 hypothetical protein N825_10205 [Skermanella stibiiresistens SB22]